MEMQLQLATTHGQNVEQDDSMALRVPVECVAENNPKCRITCAGGQCVALYHDPAGPCVAQCLGEGVKPIALSDKFSLQLVANSGRPVAELFERDIPEFLAVALRKYERPVVVRGRFSRKEFVRHLTAIVGRELPPDEGSATA